MTIQEFFKARKLSASSYRAYMQRLRKLNGGIEPTTIAYLEDVESILNTLSSLSNNTQRSYLITVLEALKSTNNYEDAKDVYELKLDELENIRQENEENYRMSDKEAERMCSFEELQLVVEYWLDIIDEYIFNDFSPNKVYNVYKNALISLLYVEQAPIRLEYASMIVINNTDEIKKGNNYILREKDGGYKFVLQEFKTKKSQGAKMWKVTSTRLKNILDEWLKINTSGFLFPNTEYDAPMSTNAFGKHLPKVFESIGKKITLNILRHVWISHNVDYKVLDEHAALANAMCHSIGMQKTYVKV